MAYKPVKGPTVVCSVFVEKDGKFLLVFCPGFRLWRVPGGRVERGETLEQTLIREMKEELNITLENSVFLGYGQDQEYHFTKQEKTNRLLMFFHAKTDEEVIIDPKEASEHKWFTFEELKIHENKEGALIDFFERNPELVL